MLSVIVPAHNEEAVIDRCLRELTATTELGELEVIVVANGCTDRTAEIARSYPGVRVAEVERASKHAAIKRGDELSRGFPRAFVDADIEVSGTALLETGRAMEASGALVAAPALRLDMRDCSWLVRSYYRVWRMLDWSTNAPVGSGVFVLSEAGRARLGELPDIINDDQYVHDSFVPSERLCVASQSFLVRPARNVRALIARRTRTMTGRAELHERFGPLPGASGRANLVGLVRSDPRRTLDIAVFCAVTLLARVSTARKRRRGDVSWERDDTSRVSEGLA